MWLFLLVLLAIPQPARKSLQPPVVTRVNLVWGERFIPPVTWSRLVTVPCESDYVIDELVPSKGAPWHRITWPLYTVIRNGDTLTANIFGSENERVMMSPGFRERDDDEWSVTVYRGYVNPHGELLAPQRVYGPMPKAAFDDVYGKVVLPAKRSAHIIPLPSP